MWGGGGGGSYLKHLKVVEGLCLAELGHLDVLPRVMARKGHRGRRKKDVRMERERIGVVDEGSHSGHRWAEGEGHSTMRCKSLWFKENLAESPTVIWGSWIKGDLCFPRFGERGHQSAPL